MRMARILIADDDPQTIIMLEFKLKSLGHEIMSANDGGQALEMAASESPDLVLLDLNMPVLDGFQVLRRLKSDGVTKDIPVIMLSAHGQEKEVVTGLEIGAVDYVSKPFSFAELIARVNRSLAIGA